MTLPKVYQKSGESTTNYDYFDIAAGTGIEEFYAGNVSGAYVLSNVKFYSENLYNGSNMNSATFVRMMDHDYDVVLNLPRVVRGKTIINVPTMFNNANTGTSNYYVNVIVKKVIAGAETVLVTKQGPVNTVTTTGAGNFFRMAAIDVDIPETNFKKGETLRLTVEFWGKGEIGGATYGCYAHDPNNRQLLDNDWIGENWSGIDWDITPTILTFQVPFKIDV